MDTLSRELRLRRRIDQLTDERDQLLVKLARARECLARAHSAKSRYRRQAEQWYERYRRISAALLERESGSGCPSTSAPARGTSAVRPKGESDAEIA